jgi:hypothetical protein
MGHNDLIHTIGHKVWPMQWNLPKCRHKPFLDKDLNYRCKYCQVKLRKIIQTMATITNADGSVTEFKIGEDDTEQVTTTKQSKPVTLNKDGTPRKKRGPNKQFNFPRKTLSAQVSLDDYNALVSVFGKPTEAVNQLIKLWKGQTK